MKRVRHGAPWHRLSAALFGDKRAVAQALAVIDAPAEDRPVDRFAFLVEGWVWMGAAQGRIEAVEIWAGGELLGETGRLDDRPDVCAALRIEPSRTGFSIVASHASAPRGGDAEIAARVRFVDGTRSADLTRKSVRYLGNAPSLPHRPGDEEIRMAPSATSTLALPPSHLQQRQVGGVWEEAFYREGRVILNQIRSAFSAAGKPLEQARSILDFGCGCGRVLAGFADLQLEGALTGCDIDSESIAWNAGHLAEIATFHVNREMPPTIFAAGQFDAIYAVSVFTHLPEEMQFAWLTELRRILAPGGVLIASVHGGKYVAQAPAEVRAEVAARGFAYRKGTATAGLPDFYMSAMHSEWYLREKWSRFFDVVAIHEALIHGVHDAVVLRRT